MITKTEKLIENALVMEGFSFEFVRKASKKAFQLYEGVEGDVCDMSWLTMIDPLLSYPADRLSKIILSSILIVYQDFPMEMTLSMFHIDSHDELNLLFKLMAAIRQHKEETQAQINQPSVHQLNTDELTRMKRKIILLQMENEKNEELYRLTSKELYSKSKELDELKEKQASVQPLVVQINNISGCNVIQGDIHLNKEK
ncbi:MAG: hypothetical protein PUI72_06840 [Prevotellaceae bacterium]|nr:hypothetical protein [Prevotellaceae bacterium]MDY6200269.1 hypothetical protein [Prevotella sp.]